MKERPLPTDLEGPCFGTVEDGRFYGDDCVHYRTAYYNDDTSIFYDFVENGRRYDVPEISRFECPAWLREASGFFGVGGFARAVQNPDDAFREASEAYLSGEVTSQGAQAIGGNVAKFAPYAIPVATAIDAGCSAIGY
jgi:hypothetical protein